MRHEPEGEVRIPRDMSVNEAGLGSSEDDLETGHRTAAQPRGGQKLRQVFRREGHCGSARFSNRHSVETLASAASRSHAVCTTSSWRSAWWSLRSSYPNASACTRWRTIERTSWRTLPRWRRSPTARATRSVSPSLRSTPAIAAHRRSRRSNRRKNPPAPDAADTLKTKASPGSILSPSGSSLDPTQATEL